LTLKSSKRHFAHDLIYFLLEGVHFMELVQAKKIKALTNPIATFNKYESGGKSTSKSRNKYQRIVLDDSSANISKENINHKTY
jgi:hypothetical protein